MIYLYDISISVHGPFQTGNVWSSEFEQMGVSPQIMAELDEFMKRFGASRGWPGSAGEMFFGKRRDQDREYVVLAEKYSKRSKAAYPPPRSVLDHKLNGCILSCEYTKLIVFAQNLWWMKDESIITSDDLVLS